MPKADPIRVTAEIIDGPAPSVAKLSGPTKMRLATIQNKAAMLEAVHHVGTEAVRAGYVRAASAAEHTIHDLERSDTAIMRVSAQAAEYHQTLKDNAIAHEYQMANEFAQTVRNWMQETWADLQILPDAAFYTPTLGDRFDAFLRNSYADLELRPGAPRLTFKQQLRQAFLGDVVDGIATAYDARQIAERVERREQRADLQALEGHLAALAARNAELEAITAETTGQPGLAAELDAILRNTRGRRPVTVPVSGLEEDDDV